MSENIAIVRGFSDVLRPKAASLYDAAFGAKCAVAIPYAAARIKLFAEAFDPSQTFIAMSGDKMLGIAGVKTSRDSFLSGMTWRLMISHLGWRGSLRAIVVLTLLEQDVAENQLLLDGISVLPTARGSGIGTQLVDRLKDFAAREGYRSIRLNVVDTNPAAQRLYERLGFTATTTTRLGWLRGLVGFSAVTTLEYRITAVA